MIQPDEAAQAHTTRSGKISVSCKPCLLLGSNGIKPFILFIMLGLIKKLNISTRDID